MSSVTVEIYRIWFSFTSTTRNSEDSDLEEIMSAVTRAWAIPSVNVYGFFLTMRKKISGRQMVAWIARLRDKTDINNLIEGNY